MTSRNFVGAHSIFNPSSTKPLDWGVFRVDSDRIAMYLFAETHSEDPDAQGKPSSILQHRTLDTPLLPG